MALSRLLSTLGDEIEDPETETFMLFAQSRPSQDLGYVDKTKTMLELSIAGRDFNIQQSPTLLSSDRAGGTTGAVLWKITPLFAEWLVNSSFMSILNADSTVLELGCGISGLLVLLIGPKVGHYIATDQNYVFKLLQANLNENALRSGAQQKRKTNRKQTTVCSNSNSGFTTLMALDWETNVVSDFSRSSASKNGIDLLIACDCIYNESLIQPFVNACAELSRMSSTSANKSTVCIIAQQLRSDTVFGEWLLAFHKLFRVWRVPDDLLTEELKEGSGFCVHIGMLRRV